MGGAKRYPLTPVGVAMGIASLHPSYADTTSRSRGAFRPRFDLCLPSSENRGRREDRVLAAPRSRVRFAQTKLHTSIQGSGNTPAFPAQGSVWGQKVELIQRGATVVFTFVSRSAIDLAAERNMGTC
jgi:hypothetical protein